MTSCCLFPYFSSLFSFGLQLQRHIHTHEKKKLGFPPFCYYYCASPTQLSLLTFVFSFFFLSLFFFSSRKLEEEANQTIRHLFFQHFHFPSFTLLLLLLLSLFSLFFFCLLASSQQPRFFAVLSVAAHSFYISKHRIYILLPSIQASPLRFFFPLSRALFFARLCVFVVILL